MSVDERTGTDASKDLRGSDRLLVRLDEALAREKNSHNKARDELAARVAEIASLKDQLDTMRVEVSGARRAAEQAELARKDAEAKADNLSRRVDRSTKDGAIAANENQRFRRLIDTLRRTLDERERELLKLRKDADILTRRITADRIQLAARDDDLRLLDEQFEREKELWLTEVETLRNLVERDAAVRKKHEPAAGLGSLQAALEAELHLREGTLAKVLERVHAVMVGTTALSGGHNMQSALHAFASGAQAVESRFIELEKLAQRKAAAPTELDASQQSKALAANSGAAEAARKDVNKGLANAQAKKLKLANAERLEAQLAELSDELADVKRRYADTQNKIFSICMNNDVFERTTADIKLRDEGINDANVAAFLGRLEARLMMQHARTTGPGMSFASRFQAPQTLGGELTGAIERVSKLLGGPLNLARASDLQQAEDGEQVEQERYLQQASEEMRETRRELKKALASASLH